MPTGVAGAICPAGPGVRRWAQALVSTFLRSPRCAAPVGGARAYGPNANTFFGPAPVKVPVPQNTMPSAMAGPAVQAP